MTNLETHETISKWNFVDIFSVRIVTWKMCQVVRILEFFCHYRVKVTLFWPNIFKSTKFWLTVFLMCPGSFLEIFRKSLSFSLRDQQSSRSRPRLEYQNFTNGKLLVLFFVLQKEIYKAPIGDMWAALALVCSFCLHGRYLFCFWDSFVEYLC